MIAITVVSAGEVHEDDASRTCWTGGEIIEKGLVGVGGIVTIAIAEGNFTSEEGFYFRVGRGEVESPYEVGRGGRVHTGAKVEHLGEGIDFEGDGSWGVGGREILHMESALCALWSDDGSCGLALPIEGTCPTSEDASNGGVAVVVATEDEYLSTHIAHLKVWAKVDEEAAEAVLSEQLLDACVVGILHLVAISCMEHVNDNEF